MQCPAAEEEEEPLVAVLPELSARPPWHSGAGAPAPRRDRGTGGRSVHDTRRLRGAARPPAGRPSRRRRQALHRGERTRGGVQ